MQDASLGGGDLEQFTSYEDYLDAQVSETDMYYRRVAKISARRRPVSADARGFGVERPPGASRRRPRRAVAAGSLAAAPRHHDAERPPGTARRRRGRDAADVVLFYGRSDAVV